MGTRLKKRLANLGVDPSSAKANESFCLIGTPLPPLEKSKDGGEFVPLWKQDVRDEQGRRRLHGAFTGGFSAGYFNTVGSKEGWTPSTFISSRSDRAKQKTARPEDFMDEEDLLEIKERQGLLDTTDEMDFSRGTLGQDGADGLESDSVASALEASMLPPPRDSVGARILRKMGWKIGQGIGPRLTWHQRKLQDMQASGGQEDTSDGIQDDEEAKKHTYAPRDTPILLVDRKDNSHGLGYSPGIGLNETLGVKGRDGASGPKLAAGFGLGALNDADDDDVDVYDGNLNRGRTRVAYDASDREFESRTVIARRNAQARKVPETRSASSMQTFRDGAPVLPGFVLSENPVADDRWFPLPDIPKGWSPNPVRVWENDKENLPSKSEPAPASSHSKWKTGKSADERGSILGETPLPAAPRSVFEYLSQKDRDRLKNITSAISSSAPESTASPTGRPPMPNKITIAKTEPHIAQAALHGFQPFTMDPEKHARYNAYLQSQAFPDKGPCALEPLSGQNVDEFNTEMESYAKAALLFKPMSGAMASRFTAAAVVEHGPNIHEGLHTPSVSDPSKGEEPPAKEVEKKAEEDPKVHAARVGMYGPLTREVKPWQPARLLCKRFGVKDPNPEPEPEPASSTTTAPSWQPAPEASTATESGAPSSSGTPNVAPDGSASRKGGRRDLANIGLGEDEDQGRDTLSYVRPAMDIFKAIFASDDEHSDGDDDGGGEPGGDENRIEASMPSTSGTNVARSSAAVPSTSPAQTLPEKIDAGTFKPTFIPRSERDGRSKEKKEKKSKKNKHGKAVLVSFELEEGGGGVDSVPREKVKERPKKKKREGRREEKDKEDDAMWVEKSRPEIVLEPPDIPMVNAEDGIEPGHSRGRKRAIDFM